VDSFLEAQTFNAVVDAGSFVKASDALNGSKAAVSRYIVDMETRLGVRRLHRSARWPIDFCWRNARRMGHAW